MKYSHIMVHFGELGTKGENKRLFINELSRQVHWALRNYDGIAIRVTRDHLYVQLNGLEPSPIINRLQQVSGIQRLSLVHRCDSSLEALTSSAIALMKEEMGATFKIKAKRADKKLPLDSYALSCALADAILSEGRWHVDVHHPDVTLHVEVREGDSYLYTQDFPGAGGYPLGCNGKAMMMLSGGIDSPVAAYQLLRRGIRIECLHFAAPPYTSDAVIDKLRDIIAILGEYQDEIKLHIVPFTNLQLAIYANVPEPYCITIMRRMMFRIAESMAKKRGCLAIASGESIGQVASQTLASLVAINAVSSYPIIRPLATSDKVNIIKTAERIGTYDISIKPFEDCCTIFKPRNPKTRPNLAECERFETLFDYQALIDDCLKNIKTETITA